MDGHEREQFATELRRLRDRAGLSLENLPGGRTSTTARVHPRR
jgi:hypothetical protein